MSKTKELFIQMQNEEWERMSGQERAIIETEREMEEHMLWLEIQKEEEALKSLEKAKIVTDDVKEVQENPGQSDKAGCLHGSGDGDRRSESETISGQ